MIILGAQESLNPVEIGSVGRLMMEIIGRKDTEEAVRQVMMIVTRLETMSAQRSLTVIDIVDRIVHLRENEGHIMTMWTRMLVNTDTTVYASRERFECVGSDRC